MAKKILLVEDEELIQKLLQRRLGAEGFEVMSAKDGQEGLAAMRQTRPDVVLLDIVMPRKNGFQVLEEMQKDENLRNIPAIIISNSGQPVELDRAKQLGAKDWLIKTEFDPQEVTEKIRKQLE